MKRLRLFALVSILAWLGSCTRPPLQKPEQALRLATAPALSDDLDLDPLLAGIRSELTSLRASSTAAFSFGPRKILKRDYAAALDYLLTIAATGGKGTLLEVLRHDFDFYQIYGGRRWGEVLLTSYYEPEIRGAAKKTSAFTEPLLKRPADLVEVVLSKFDDRYKDLGPMRGRLVETPDKLQLLPYWTRAEIARGKLANRGLELCWVDPIDSFFLQIQGSGTVLLDDGGKVRVGFADQNGHRYESIGKFMLAKIPLENMTSNAIESYLRGLSPEARQEYFDKNPSFIFFRKLDGAPTTSFGVPVVAGRTIATDYHFFPKGALAFLSFQKPTFASAEGSEPNGWVSTSRLVLDQDNGGAIKGGGRVDLFWGTGAEARRAAGNIKQRATLYYIAPKEELVKRLGIGR